MGSQSGSSVRTWQLERSHHEAIKCGDGVRLRPKSDLSRSEAAVVMIDQQPIIEPALDMVAFSADAHFMPLPKRRRLHADPGDRVATTALRGTGRFGLVIIKVEIVLQRVGPDDVIATFGKAKYDSTGSVLTPGDGFETHVDVDIGVGAARRDNDIEGLVRGTLDQRLAAFRSSRHILGHPRAAYRLPAVERSRKVIACLRLRCFTRRADIDAHNAAAAAIICRLDKSAGFAALTESVLACS